MKAALSPCRRAVTLSGPTWSETFPAERLAAKIAFYTRLRDRSARRPAPAHVETVASLQAVAAELERQA